MRKAFWAIAAILFLTSPACAQSAAMDTAMQINRTISVTGEAEIRVVPDQVLISMTAESRGADLLATQAKNDKAVADLIEYAAKTLDIEPDYIQTDFTSIDPVYRQCHFGDELAGKCNPLDIVYYNVRKGVQVRLNDISRYEDLITRALQLGVTQINNVQFLTTQLRVHRDKARELAAQASREKAEAIAGTLGVKVGKPVTINTHNYSSYYGHGSARRGQDMMAQNVMQNMGSPSSGAEAEALALGQINISATVNVTFEIE